MFEITATLFNSVLGFFDTETPAIKILMPYVPHKGDILYITPEQRKSFSIQATKNMDVFEDNYICVDHKVEIESRFMVSQTAYDIELKTIFIELKPE